MKGIKVVVSAVIITVAIMLATAAVSVPPTQSASAYTDPDQRTAGHSSHEGVKGYTDLNQRNARD